MRSLGARLANTRSTSALAIGMVFTLLLLVRNAIIHSIYGYAFYSDSSLYVLTGATLFKTWLISPLITLPYPLLNALTRSYQNPLLLIWTQMVLGALAGGLLVYIVARRDRLTAIVIGALFVFDIIWAALTRTILTDALFASFNIMSLALLVSHYDRRTRVEYRELVLSGLLYAWTLTFRPSSLFLAVCLPPLYMWLTRSWKKTLALICGMALFFAVVGLANWRGTGRFFILASRDSYTDVGLAYPLFIYKVYSPDNGPASRQLDGYLQYCFPGVDYATAVDRAPGGAFDSANNMTFMQDVILCVKSAVGAPELAKGLFPKAYMEAFTKQPFRMIQVLYQEHAVFMRYNNPYVLRLQLSASKNSGCHDIPWCDQIRQSHHEWNQEQWLPHIYEKIASKVLQVYLVPVGILAGIAPERYHLPFTIAWIGLMLFLLLTTRGRIRFLVLLDFLLIQYTVLVVVLGLGFNERYASMLSPLQAVLSGVAYATSIRWIAGGLRKYRRPGANQHTPALLSCR